MEVREAGEGAAHGLGHRSVIAALAVAGIAGPVLFTVAFVVQGLFRLDEYSPVAEVVSALEAGPGGWVQQVNFVVFGLLTVAFAVGLYSRCCSPAQSCWRSDCWVSREQPMRRVDRPRHVQRNPFRKQNG